MTDKAKRVERKARPGGRRVIESEAPKPAAKPSSKEAKSGQEKESD